MTPTPRPPPPRAPRPPARDPQGVDGAQALGWPAFHRSTVHASPLLYDWDLDGTPDILVSTYNGEILAFKDTVGVGGGVVCHSLLGWGGVGRSGVGRTGVWWGGVG